MCNSIYSCLVILCLVACSDVETDFEPASYLLEIPANETPCAPQSLPATFPVCTLDRFLAEPYGWFTARMNGELVVGSAHVFFVDTLDSDEPGQRRFRLTLQTHLEGPCINISSLLIENMMSNVIGEVQQVPYYSQSSSYTTDFRNGVVTKPAAEYTIEEYDIDYAYYQPDTSVLFQPSIIVDCINERDSLFSGRGAGRFTIDPDFGFSTDNFPDTIVIDSLRYQAHYFN